MATFRARQFCSGYMYFTFEAKDQANAMRLIDLHNEGEDGLVLVEKGFDADDGGELKFVSKE